MRKPWERGPSLGAKVLLLACLGLIGSGCAWIVPRAEFEEKQKENRATVTAIRTELLAHTQILANHGKAINEVRLQMRDALSGGKTEERMARPAAPEMKKARLHQKAATTILFESNGGQLKAEVLGQ